MVIPADRAVVPETELLRLCARRVHSAEDAAALGGLLDGPLDWRLILHEAQRHGLLALLHDILARASLVGRVPEIPRQALVDAVRRIAGRSLCLTAELLCILRHFAAEQIPVMPFKGPVVAVAAYRDLALRSFGDLDILVPESHLSGAREVMAKIGYRPVLTLEPVAERAYFESECALQFHHPGQGHTVELHWRFTERNASVELPMADIWSRAADLQLGGVALKTLCPDDLILYLSVHGAKHRWERLEWICCFAELIRNHPGIDWPAVFERARQCRTVRILNLSLCLAQTFCGAPLHPVAQAELAADRSSTALAVSLGETLFLPEPNSHYQQRAARYFFMLRSREHWKDRLRILLYSAFKPPHPEAAEWVDLPPRLAFLYRLVRPVRLLGEYSAVAFRYYRR